MKRCAAAMLAVIVTAFLPAVALAQAGFVFEIEGEATVIRPDGSSGPLQAGDTLQAGLQIRTGPNAQLTLKLADGEVIRLAPGTTIALRRFQFNPQSLGASVSEVALVAGAIRVLTGAIGTANPGGLRIDVGSSVIRGGQSRGAEVIVIADAAATSAASVTVVTGSVMVGSNLLVGQGQFVQFQDGQALRQPVPLIAAPAVVQATVNGLRDAPLPDREPVVIASAARAAAAVAAANRALRAAAANPGNAQLQAAARAAAEQADAAGKLAATDSAALSATVSAAIIAALPATAAGQEVVDASPVFNATPPVGSCVGSPC